MTISDHIAFKGELVFLSCNLFSLNFDVLHQRQFSHILYSFEEVLIPYMG